MPSTTDNIQRIARFLLLGPRPFTINLIGELIQVPQPSVYEITRWLKYHRAIVQEGGYWVPDAHRLLGLVASTRRGDVVPARTLSTDGDAVRVHQILDRHQVRHAFGYLTAANLHLYYQPEPRIQLLVPSNQVTTARRALPEGDRPVEIYARDLEHTGTQVLADGLPATDLLETAIDVRAHPDGGPHADILLQALARPGPGGRAHG